MYVQRINLIVYYYCRNYNICDKLHYNYKKIEFATNLKYKVISLNMPELEINEGITKKHTEFSRFKDMNLYINLKG